MVVLIVTDNDNTHIMAYGETTILEHYAKTYQHTPITSVPKNDNAIYLIPMAMLTRHSDLYIDVLSALIHPDNQEYIPVLLDAIRNMNMIKKQSIITNLLN